MNGRFGRQLQVRWVYIFNLILIAIAVLCFEALMYSLFDKYGKWFPYNVMIIVIFVASNFDMEKSPFKRWQKTGNGDGLGTAPDDPVPGKRRGRSGGGL